LIKLGFVCKLRPKRFHQIDPRLTATAAGTPETKPNGIFADPMLAAESGAGVRYRAPSQEVTHIGTIPKRTESLYLKFSETADSKRTVSSVDLRPML
jgi:hypothetical protein